MKRLFQHQVIVNSTVKYTNKILRMFVHKKNMARIDCWECLDETGSWTVFSWNGNVIKRIKVSPRGDVLEELND
jgi:hypothetical protein